MGPRSDPGDIRGDDVGSGTRRCGIADKDWTLYGCVHRRSAEYVNALHGSIRAAAPSMGQHSPSGHIRRRSYCDASGVFWTVEFRDRVDALSRQAEAMLVFTSPSGFRCVRDFPSEWYLLDDGELENLSWKT